MNKKYLISVYRRLRYNPLKQDKKNNKKGVALLMAITSLILMVYIASEVSKDSTLEYVITANESNRLKAYYAAKNSVDIALLRIKIYQQISQMNLPPSISKEIDQIWKFPFLWPLPIAADASSFTKDDTDKVNKAALFTGQYEHTITDEGSKIDINDLVSPSKNLQEVTYQQILNIFESKIESDDEFRNVYQNYDFKELINRIVDWMSPVNTTKNGGDKRAAFQELNQVGAENYPPNRGFRTLDEIRLVPGMTDEFFQVLAPQITIYGMKAINPNIASQKVLKSLDKNLTDEAIKAAIERRDNPEKGGQFKGENSEQCRNDFKSFVEGYSLKLAPEFDKIPFNCNKIMNFKIEATGRSGSGKGASQKKITVIVVDLAATAANIKSYVDAEKKAQQNQSQSGEQLGQAGPPIGGQSSQTGQTGPSTSQKEPLPKGRPRIVYWSEN